jgi:hypothetical protein
LIDAHQFFSGLHLVNPASISEKTCSPGLSIHGGDTWNSPAAISFLSLSLTKTTNSRFIRPRILAFLPIGKVWRRIEPNRSNRDTAKLQAI